MNIETLEDIDNTVLDKIQKHILFEQQVLQELDLDNMKIPEISLKIKEKIESFQLYTLTMNGCGLMNLKNLPKILNLTRVNFSFVDYLTQQLELSQNNFESEELSKIPATYPHLTTLILQENQIQNFKQLHFVDSLKNLFQLDLTGTPLSRELNYRHKVFELLPQIDVLDGLDKNGCPFEFADDEIELADQRDDDDGGDDDDDDRSDSNKEKGDQIDDEEDDDSSDDEK